MADEVVKTSTEGNEEAKVSTSETPQVDLKEYVKVTDFRAMQGAKDKRIAEAERRAQEVEDRLSKMQEQMETLVNDPSARAKMREERMSAELERYRQREALVQTRHMFAEQWGVPEGVLAEASNPQEMTKAALDWQAEQIRAAKAEPKKEEDAPISAPVGRPPTPDGVSASQMDIDKKIAELMKVAHAGGPKGAQARVEMLKLEEQRARPRRQRPQV